MRPSIRFDVFKRDGFTCAYCGRKPPTVTLEVDHLIPVADGGPDTFDNLVTACWDCNRGKGGTPLDAAPPALGDLAERAELLREREQQLRAYHAALEEIQRCRDQDFTEVYEYWFDLWDEQSLPRSQVPFDATLRKYVGLLGVSEVRDAMEITCDRFTYPNARAPRYLAGILRRRASEEGLK